MSQMAATRDRVAILGMGTMGHGMATSCLRAGISTIVWDRRPDRCRDLVDLGGEVAPTAADAAAAAEVVVTMVSDLQAVLAIATEQGVLDALVADAIWVQMSTIGMGIDRVAALVETHRPDVTLLDAPVSGSKEPAERGELTIFASGPKDARRRVARLFDALGQRTIWVGPTGAGSRMKLVNNTLLAFKAEGLAAAVALSQDLGLTTSDVIDALEGGPLLSAWDQAKLPRMANGEYSAQFALGLALKDVHLALETVDTARFEALTSLAREWERAVDHGLGGKDLTVVARDLQSSGPDSDD